MNDIETQRRELLRLIRRELRRATVRELELIWVFARNLCLPQGKEAKA